MTFPANIDEIHPDWINATLRSSGVLRDSKVVSLRNQVIGEEAGFLSTVARVMLDYDHVEIGAPSTVIVKLQPADAHFVQAEHELHAFKREMRFYDEVAPAAPIRLPRIYGLPEDPPHAALIMEDLSFATMGDQVIGMHHDQVVNVACTMGRLQAKYWANESLASLDWMPRKDHFDDDFVSKWPVFADRYRDVLSDDAISLGERVCNILPEIRRQVSLRPKTIVHQDLRADNIAFSQGKNGEEAIIIDWQLAVRSMGAFDIARLLGGSESMKERRGHQTEVVRAWHDELLEGGVVDYSWDEALRDFKLGALTVLAFPVHFCSDKPSAGSRADVLFTLIAERLFASALEIDAISAV